jgi:subtilase family serine protease
VSTLGSRQADFPGDGPFVTAVGGTSLGVGASNQYLFETGWGTGKSVLTNGAWAPRPDAPKSWLYGGGGGTSTVFPEPWYQHGVVPKSLSM